MFSRFFIDRPIFAAVISVFFVLAGLAAMRSLPIAQYPEIAPPVVTVTAVYPGASAEVLEQTVAAPLENAINGVQRMLYMESHSTAAGVTQITVTFEIGTNVDDACDQRQQPRQAGRAAPAARSPPAGRDGRARLLVLPAGARVLLAGRPLRRSLHFELRDAERAGRAEAASGHDQRPDLRRERLRDADLAEARPPCPAQADARRHCRGHQRAERAVRRRQDRPDADRRQAGPGLHDHDPRPARGPEGIRPDHRARQSRRLDGAPCRRRARGAGREGLRFHRPLQRPPGHPRRHLPRARGPTPSTSRRPSTAAPRRSRRSFPRASPTPFRTTPRILSKCRSRKWSRRWPRPCCWCSSSSTSFCKAGAPP